MKWSVLLCLLLAGCVTSYAPPENKTHPKIRFDMKNIKSLLFFEEGRDCSHAAKLESPHNPYLPGAKPLPVRGNKLMALQMTYANSRESCNVTMSFVPRFNHDYVVYNKLKFDQRRNISCSFKVIRKHRAAKQAQWKDEETVRIRKPVKAIKTDVRHCR